MRFFWGILIILSSIGFSDEFNAKLVGQAIWASLPDQNVEFISAFIKGMQEKKTSPSKEELSEIYYADQQALELLELKEELLAADQFFLKLQEKKELQEVVPGKVYFRLKQEGAGKEILNTFCEVIASYTIKTIENSVICSSNSIEKRSLPLSGLMPGLARGMIGMKEGEKRELYIHPEYGYSEILLLKHHPALVITVTLETVFEDSTTQQFSMEPNIFSVSKISKEELEQNYRHLHLKFAYQYGQMVRDHYKWGEPTYLLEDIVSNINQTTEANVVDLSLPSMQNKLMELHWWLYQKQGTWEFLITQLAPIFP